MRYKLLDPFFCNVKQCYQAKKLPPLGISDHVMCQLIPVYKTVLKRSKPTERTVYEWNDEVNEVLIGCMESTDFEVMFDESMSVDYNVEVLTAYIRFCIDIIVPSKVVKCFGNNKPWVTKDLKGLLNKKKYLIATNDRAELKMVQKQIDKAISDCKEKHKA